MTELKWENPSRAGGSYRRSKHFPEEVQATLRSRPGEWALILEGGFRNIAHDLRSSFLEFEFKTRDHYTKLYARYVGEKK